MHVAATMMARHHDDARRAAHVRTAHVRAGAVHAAMAHAITMHALRGSGNGGKNRRGGGENQCKIFHGIPWGQYVAQGARAEQALACTNVPQNKMLQRHNFDEAVLILGASMSTLLSIG